MTTEIVKIDWDAVHEKLIEVWHRDISADEALEEIKYLIKPIEAKSKESRMTKEVKQEQNDSVSYIKEVIEALYENSDPVSVEAAELLERINAKQEQNEPVAWVDLLKDAEQIIKDKFLYKRFIDGTPLSNDIPCWMVDFAQKYATPQPKQKQGEFVANDPLPRACNLAGVDYQTFLKIKTYMPLYTTPQPKEWVGLTEYEIKGVLGLSESWVGEDCSIPDMIGFAKAIQAKSKEKNYVVFGK